MASVDVTAVTAGLSPEGANADLFVGWYKKGKGKGKAQPWDIETAQHELVALHKEQPTVFESPVLDIGSGLGDNAIWLASVGATVVSVDVSPEAVEEAQARLARHGPTSGSVEFVLCNVLEPPLPDSVSSKVPFSTVLDSAVFHCIGDDATQTKYVEAFTPLVKKGGHLVMLIFSDKNPDPWQGPRRISEEHLRKYFCQASGWKIQELVESKYSDNIRREGASTLEENAATPSPTGFGWAWRMIAERL